MIKTCILRLTKILAALIIFLFSCKDMKNIYSNFEETQIRYDPNKEYGFLEKHLGFDKTKNFILKKEIQRNRLKSLIKFVDDFYNNQRIRSYYRENPEVWVNFFTLKDYIENIKAKATITFNIPGRKFNTFFFTKRELLKGIDIEEYEGIIVIINEIKKIAIPISQFIEFFSFHNPRKNLFENIDLDNNFKYTHSLRNLLKYESNLRVKIDELNEIFSNQRAKRIDDFKEELLESIIDLSISIINISKTLTSSKENRPRQKIKNKIAEFVNQIIEVTKKFKEIVKKAN